MSLRILVTSWITLALLMTASANWVNAQEGEREQRRHVNELEKKLKEHMTRLEDVNAALERVDQEKHPDQHDELMAFRKELNSVITEIRNEFGVMEERRANRARRRTDRRDSDRAEDEEKRRQRVNRLEYKYRQHQEQLMEIEAFLERHAGSDDYLEKRKKLEGQRKELLAAMEEMERHFKELRQAKNRDRDDLHPEIRTAMNQLEHLEHAHGHLREAGMGEIAQMVEQRANKIRQGIERYHEQRERDHQRKREQDEAHRERSESDEAFRNEVSGAIRELSAAIRALRNDVEELKKRDR